MRRPHTALLLVLLTIASAAVLTTVTVAACGDSGEGAGSPAASDRVVLLVDGRPVRQSAVDAVKAEFRLGGTEAGETRAEKETVRRELLRQEAERLGVRADPVEVESRRAAMVEQAGGEDALTVSLQGVPITDRQLRSGLRDGVLHEAVQDAKFGGLRVTRRQARAYYDAHLKAFHVVASVHLFGIQVAAERIAENALARLRSGHPFAEVARQFSTDLEAKAKGGDMGVVTLASLPAPLRDAVAAVPSGRVTKPVQGPGGWFVLKATQFTPEHTPSFTEVGEQLQRELTRRKRFRALEGWLDAARDRATVARP